MNRKCRLIDSKVVAITDTQVEHNLVTIDPHQYANPRYQVAILIELEERGKRPWDIGAYHILLLFNGLLFSLNESDLDNRTFKFELMDEVAPQIESMIDIAVDKAL